MKKKYLNTTPQSKVAIIIHDANTKHLRLSENLNFNPKDYLPFSAAIEKKLNDKHQWQGKRHVFKHHLFQVNIYRFIHAQHALDIEVINLDSTPTWQEYDPLTKLLQGQSFLKRLQQQIKKTNVKALILLDLDYFKEINDLYGHHLGNQVLVQIGKRLQHSIQENGYCCRLGGDEFGIMILKTFHDDISQYAKTLLKQISKPLNLNQKQISITASIGIALFPCDGKTHMELLDNADLSMYESKNKNRNTFHFYKPQLRQQETEKVRLHYDLRHALHHQEFELYLQPIVDLKNNQVYQAEFYIRWQHPKIGLIQPSDFMHKIVNFEILLQLDDWVLTHSLALIQEWQKNNLEFKFFINLSALEFLFSRNNLETWQKLLKNYHQSLKHVVIEFTEDIFLGHYKEHLDKLMVLEQQGIEFAIDNFGSGISNFSFLKTMNAKYLKLSSFFIQNIDNPKERQLLKALIDFAHSLKLKVIAEGVETHLQYKYLQELDCDFGQGYWFAQPLAIASFKKRYIN